jgi:hypothetical protein
MVPLTSFPFDFASYVYQVRQFFDFDLHPLFYWNKGTFLLGIWYLQYALYTGLLDLFNLTKENPLLLHTLFKLPLLLADVFTGVVLGKLALQITGKRWLKDWTFLLWTATPTVFWMVVLQGQYAILATLGVTISLYCIARKRFSVAAVTLAVASSIYYYPVLFVPFFALYQRYDQRETWQSVMKTTACFVVTLVILFLPFFFSFDRLKELGASLAHHAAPDAPRIVDVVSVPNASLFRFPHYLLTGEFPTNENAPFTFGLASRVTLIGLGVAGGYISWRLISVYRRQVYQLADVVRDMLAVLLIFILLIGKFQTHYIIWLLPLILLAVLVHPKNRHLVVYYLIFGVVPIVGILGANNLGIYFLDTVPWGTVNVWFSHSDYTKALSGFVTMLMLAALLGETLGRGRLRHKAPSPSLIIGGTALYALFFVCMGFFTLTAYREVIRGNLHTKLASDSSLFNFPLEVDDASTIREEVERIEPALLNTSFEEVATTRQISTGYLAEGPWYFYSYGSPGAMQAGISTTARHKGSQALYLVARAEDGKGQINLSGNPIGHYVPVEQHALYGMEAYVLAEQLEGGDAVMAVRFANDAGEIIPGSDQVIGRVQAERGWQRIAGEFVANRNASYMEPLFSVYATDSGTQTAGKPVYLDDLSVHRQTVWRYQQWTLRPKGRFDQIDRNILQATSTQSHFKVRVEFNNVHPITHIETLQFNRCDYEQTYPEKLSTIYLFDAACMIHGENILDAKFVNPIRDDIDMRISLTHQWNSELYLASKKSILYLVFFVSLVINILMVYFSLKVLNRIVRYESKR